MRDRIPFPCFGSVHRLHQVFQEVFQVKDTIVNRLPIVSNIALLDGGDGLDVNIPQAKALLDVIEEFLVSRWEATWMRLYAPGNKFVAKVVILDMREQLNLFGDEEQEVDVSISFMFRLPRMGMRFRNKEPPDFDRLLEM